ncbi:MAG: PAS domain S-box protein [Nitrospirae bacterium]|nr:PAS domain S-box protein [Nitrospirota bacterium]
MDNMTSKQKILLVDDTPSNLLVLGEELKADYEVFIATSGESALKKIFENPPDLILLDIIMPGMDGYEVCRRLKESKSTHDIPVIFITAKNAEEDETKGLDIGAVDYITKPFSLPIVRARVKTHLERKRHEEELRLHGKIAEELSEGILFVRCRDGIIVFANSKLEKLFGYDPDELIGKHVSILNAPADKDPKETADEIMRNLNEKKIWRGEIKNIRKNGMPFWCQASVTMFELREHGAVWISVHTDITERKKAEDALRKSEKQLKDITSSLAEGIYISDNRGNILFLNPESERLLGWTMIELMNRHVHNVFHYKKTDGSPLPQEECNIDKVIRTGIPYVSRDEVFIRKDGMAFPVSVVSSPIMENGKVVAAVTAFRDITERKKIEAEREELIVDLRKALSEVKQLSGLLPICASCKNIRDDKGYWNQIETYISEHSEALFTHAICPECGKKLYPQYYDEIWGKEDK